MSSPCHLDGGPAKVTRPGSARRLGGCLVRSRPTLTTRRSANRCYGSCRAASRSRRRQRTASALGPLQCGPAVGALPLQALRVLRASGLTGSCGTMGIRMADVASGSFAGPAHPVRQPAVGLLWQFALTPGPSPSSEGGAAQRSRFPQGRARREECESTACERPPSRAPLAGLRVIDPRPARPLPWRPASAKARTLESIQPLPGGIGQQPVQDDADARVGRRRVAAARAGRVQALHHRVDHHLGRRRRRRSPRAARRMALCARGTPSARRWRAAWPRRCPTTASMRPGCTTTTCTPKGATSTRMASDSTSTECLVADTSRPAGVQPRPAIELMLTMRRGRRRASTAAPGCDRRTRPNTLTSNCRRASAIETSSSAP